MQPVRLKVPLAPSSSFHIRHEIVPYFQNPWHFHPELELTLILKGDGLRFVGDSIKPFHEGDLVLLGKNLPHYWRSDEAYYESNTTRLSEAIILRFLPDSFGSSFFQLTEMTAISQLLNKSLQGLQFVGETQQEVRALLGQLMVAVGAERVILFLKIFNLLANAREYVTLASKSFNVQTSGGEVDRIDKVYDHIMKHFKEDITLDDVVDVASMNKAAFCRYFKAKTNKTFSEFLNEVRIGHASKLLLDDRLSISQISYECGFKEQSYFNTQFRKVTGYTPSEYRKISRQ